MKIMSLFLHRLFPDKRYIFSIPVALVPSVHFQEWIFLSICLLLQRRLIMNLSYFQDYKIHSLNYCFYLRVSYLLVLAMIRTLIKSTVYLPSAGTCGVWPYPPSLSRDAPMRAYCTLLPNGCTGRIRRVISPTSRATECIGEY